ncbi:hypothetical protein J2S78_002821 [Salibacterium salarium]|uniref:hypothetical protein n=1 Tax=Salibacterium salarium TaxID=284579 RepID=UPI002788B45B|nr:hypothetical protein [Salibacterium salarium]MDQ0300374.1 hypothetical protein [Salibacterium salarium]
MFNQLLLWSTFIIPWFALIPLNKTDVKKFIPAALFGALILTFVFQVADKFNWWEIEENIILLTNTTPFVYGLFFVGTIIILYFTYHHFLFYLLTNLIIDGFLSFGISKWYEHLGIYKLININSVGVYLLTTVIAILIYGFQKWQDTVMI